MATYWFAILVSLGIGGVIYGSLVPGHLRPRSGLDGHIEHALAYFVLGVLLLAFIQDFAALGLLLLLLLIFAAMMEILQIWIPGRSCRFTHFMASCLGAWGAVAVGAGTMLLSN